MWTRIAFHSATCNQQSMTLLECFHNVFVVVGGDGRDGRGRLRRKSFLVVCLESQLEILDDSGRDDLWRLSWSRHEKSAVVPLGDGRVS